MLGGGGVLLLALSLALRRRFAGESQSQAGFTDRALCEPDERRGFLEIAATLAALSPAPRQQPPLPGVEPGGGDFGGGGASADF